MSNFIKINKSLSVPGFGMLLFLFLSNVSFAEGLEKQALPDKMMLRLGSFFVTDSSTVISLNGGAANIGTTIDFQKDLGAEETSTVPKLDFYYRFSDKHRLDFQWFQVKRDGSRDITVTINAGDEVFQIGDRVNSSIKNSIYKLAYT